MVSAEQIADGRMTKVTDQQGVDAGHTRVSKNDIATAKAPDRAEIPLRIQDTSGLEMFESYGLRRVVQRQGMHIRMRIVLCILDCDTKLPRMDHQHVTVVDPLLLQLQSVKKRPGSCHEIGREDVCAIVDDGDMDGGDLRMPQSEFAPFPRPNQGHDASAVNSRLCFIARPSDQTDMRTR